MSHTSNNNYFENEYGSISFNKVILSNENLEFNYKKIAYLEINEKSFFLFKRYFLRIIFTNATLKDISIRKKNLMYAKKFETGFLYARAKNAGIE